MHIDILIFALIALVLALKLKSILGTRNGSEASRGNPFADNPASSKVVEFINHVPEENLDTVIINPDLIDSNFNQDGRIDTGLEEIAEEDPSFDVNDFVDGSKYAFELIVTSFSKGERDELKPLLSPKLYEDFNNTITARELVGHKAETEIHRIKDAKIIEAHLGGTMAYITVSYDVEQTMVTRDKAGVVIEGDPDKISNVKDIWTFTRDIRSEDLNWILIETRAAEK